MALMAKKKFIHMLICVAAMYAAFVLFLYIKQRSFIYFPDPRMPERSAYGAEDMLVVTVAPAHGAPVSGWFRPPAEPGKPVLLLFHGNGGNLAMRAGMMRAFMDMGYGTLLAGYSGYGGNPGQPSETAFYDDARAYVGWLQKEGFSPDKIVLYGESLGTGVAVEMAKEYPGVRALILQSPYRSLLAVGRRRFFFVPVGLLMKDRYDSISKIKDIHVPLLILHGERDGIVPFSEGKALFAAANQPKWFDAFPEAGHNDLYAHGAAAKILSFLGELPQKDYPVP
jgi:fermentation-respiration switch protein FrsA (DUF1100 family)